MENDGRAVRVQADREDGPKSSFSTANRPGKVPIVLVHELQAIELLAWYSDGGAKQLAWAKVDSKACAEARLTFARLAATHPVAIDGKFES
jgi:hypothetical protein